MEAYWLFALVAVGAALGNMSQMGVRLVVLVFGVFLVAGAIGCVFVGDDTPLWLLSVWQTIRAIGMSGLIGPLLTFMLSDMESRLVPHGSLAAVIICQIAATFGTAIMVFFVSVFAYPAASGAVAAAFPYQAAFAFSAVMGIISLVIVAFRVKSV